jgi:hypothetical protein
VVRAATGRCFALKLGVQPDRVLLPMLNDRMVAKGLILQYATAFFSDFLSTEGIDDLVAILRKAKLDSHLLELFPPQKRTLKDFDEHFKVCVCARAVCSLSCCVMGAGVIFSTESCLVVRPTLTPGAVRWRAPN